MLRLAVLAAAGLLLAVAPRAAFACPIADGRAIGTLWRADECAPYDVLVPMRDLDDPAKPATWALWSPDGVTEYVPPVITDTLARSAPSAAQSAPGDFQMHGWQPGLHDGRVDAFSGGFNWSYDFDLPGTVSGIRPDLKLTYNSRRMDGESVRGQSDWVGYGWRLDPPEILYRAVESADPDGCGVNGVCEPRFYVHGGLVLTWDGASHELVRSPYAADLWMAEDDQGWRIQRVGDSWLVTLPGGQRYDFGSTPDSRLRIHGEIHPWSSPIDSPQDGRLTVRWRLKTAEPRPGVVISYTYEVQTAGQQLALLRPYILPWKSGYFGTPWWMAADSERASYLTQIQWPQGQLQFERSPRWVSPYGSETPNCPDVTDAEHTCWASGMLGSDGARQQAWNTEWANHGNYAVLWQTDALRGVHLKQPDGAGGWMATRSWHFVYSRFSPADNDASARAADGSEYADLRMRTLARMDATILTNAENSTDAYDFEYVGKQARRAPVCEAGQNCSARWPMAADNVPYIAKIADVRGGLVRVNFEGHDATIASDRAWNYRISMHDVIAAPVELLKRTTYEYSDERCYFLQPDANTCAVQSGTIGALRGDSTFAGHRQVTAHLTNSDGASVLAHTRSTFSFGEEDPRAIGLTRVSATLSPEFRPMQTTTNTWTVRASASGGGFVQMSQQDSEMDGLVARSTATYDQYHNVIRRQQWAVGDPGAAQTTFRRYAADPARWIIDRMVRERQYGGVHDNDDEAGLSRETRFSYDSAPAWTLTPTLRVGDVTRMEQGAGTTWAVQETVYDTWGNPVVHTDTGRAATFHRFSSDGQYELQSSNGLSHTVSYGFYGLGGQPRASQPYGALGSVTDPNGSLTSTAYDSLGRAKHLVRPGDSPDYPSETYDYDSGQSGTTIAQHSFSGGPDGWIPGSYVSWVSTDGHDGLGALRVTRPVGVSSAATLGGRFYLNQTKSPPLPTLLPGTAYRVQGWVKGVGRICLEFVTQNAGAGVSFGCTDLGAGWQRVTGYVVMQEYERVSNQRDNATALLLYSLSEGTQALIDDVAITEVARPWRVDRLQRTQAGCAACVARTAAFFDPLGRLLQSRAIGGDNASTVSIDYGYDAADNVVAAYVPMTRPLDWSFDANPARLARPATRTGFDALRRPVSVVLPDGAASTHLYGPDADGTQSGYAPTGGRAEQVIDSAGHWHMTVYDGLGRPIRARQFDGTCPQAQGPACLRTGTWAETRYGYDAQGNLVDAVDPVGNRTVIAYDALARRTAITIPDSGAWSYAYDLRGNLVEQRDPLHERGCFYYDGLNRLIGKLFNPAGADCPAQPAPASLSEAYRYDEGGAPAHAIGRETSADNAQAQVRHAYDARGRIVLESSQPTGAGAFTTTYAYDSADRMISSTYPNGEVVRIGYNSAGQPVSLRGWDNYVTDAQYNALGQPTQVKFGNGLSQRWYYYGAALDTNWWNDMFFGRLRALCVITTTAGDCADDGRNGGPSLGAQHYFYDAAGNINVLDDRSGLSRTGANASTWWLPQKRSSYGYDAQDRLIRTCTNVSACDASQPGTAYQFDAAGNLTRIGDAVHTYDAIGGAPTHRVIQTSGPTAATFQYDAKGNLTAWASAGGSRQFTWSAANRLTRVDGPQPGQSVSYGYDAEGRLVRAVQSDGRERITPFDHFGFGRNGAPTTSEYFFNGRRIATRATGDALLSSFEQPDLGTGVPSYSYATAGAEWTFNGGSGLSGPGSAFTYGAPVAPDGRQVAFLQNQGAMRRDVSTPAGPYRVTVRATQRRNNGVSQQALKIVVDGVVRGVVTPTASPAYDFLATEVFSLGEGAHNVRIEGLRNTGDHTALVDLVHLVPAREPLAGFESPGVGAGVGAYAIAVTGTEWTFNGGSGVSGAGSAFSYGAPPAPEGAQIAFVQNLGALQRVLHADAGTFRISLRATQRRNFGASQQTLRVLVDGVARGVFTPTTGVSYDYLSSEPFSLAAGGHVLRIEGVRNTGDHTALLDGVQMFAVSGVLSSFEWPDQGVGASAYSTATVGGEWTYDAGTGVSGAGSAIASGAPVAPEGRQVAFVQRNGAMQLPVGAYQGVYRISLRATQRRNVPGNLQGLRVLVDGIPRGVFTPTAGSSYDSVLTEPFDLSEGIHTVRIEGTRSAGDHTALLDSVRLVQSSLLFVAEDHLGSPLLASDASGRVVGRAQYAPYGAAQTESAGSPPPGDLGFAGQRAGASGDLYLMGGRWYAPQLGRFISPDSMVPNPANPQDLDRYGYARGNPLKNRDPSGHWIESAIDIAFIAYDIYDINENGLGWINGLSLAADVGGLILPGVTGGGVLVRGVAEAVKITAHAEDVARAARVVARVEDAARIAERAEHVAATVRTADLVEDLARGTAHSERIAEGIQQGRIGVNILGEEMFSKAYGHYTGVGEGVAHVSAFAVGEQIYLRRASIDIYRDAVHEGTHALDYLNDFRGTVHTLEKRAYYYERQYQLLKGRPSEFADLLEVQNHIRHNYDNMLVNWGH